MTRKYEFTEESKEFEGHTLRRIRYLVDIYPYIKKGDVGGSIEGENNLIKFLHIRGNFVLKMKGTFLTMPVSKMMQLFLYLLFQKTMLL